MIEIGIIKDTPLNKIIDIRDKNQVIKAKYAIGKDDILKCSLMSEHFIEISFELNRNASFRRSDYIEWEGEKYTLRDDYRPEQINKRKYKYTLKFEALEMFFQDMQYWYLGRGLKESEWRLTGNPQYFLKYAVENANRYYKTTEFKIGTVEPTITKDISFESNTSTFDALTRIAEEFEAEWYLMGKTLHLVNKASFGDEVDFETEVSVLSMKREEGASKTAYTRILALGSTRNIPYNYRNTGDDEAVDGVYQKRLRIPAIKGDVIDAYPDMSPDEVIEGTVIFDEIYPRREGAIEAIGTIEYTDKNADTGKTTKWYAYKFKDSGLNFKKEYLLPGQELKLQFTSGNLNGMDFALAFNEKGFSKTDNSQYFEIIRNEDYGKPLPNDILKPNAGDKYVLYGFNIALVSDQYVPAGESELYDKAVEWQKKQLRDTGVYECSTVIKHFMDRQMDLAIGQKVRLIFDDENATNRSSRIMGFEKKLNNKFDAIYTVGDNSTYSRLGKIEQQIKELQVGGVVYETTGGGSGVYVIKQFDTTRPTDFNVYSAKASDAMYLNKQIGGTVEADTTFAKNMQVQGAAISDVIQNSTFTAGQFGSGFQIKRDANGQSYIEVDNLMVRRETVFNRLTIAELKSVGGTILLSLANMVISKVEDKTSTWRCYFDNANGAIPNDFAVNDQVICRKYTGKNIKYYWSKVTYVGVDFIEISKTDKDGSGVPAIGDEVVQLGNRTDVNRQYAIMLSAYGSDAPSIKQYAGVNSYDLKGKEVTVISPKGNKFAGSFTVSTNGTTTPIYKERGAFANGTTYYLNDRVSYHGSHWVCVVNTTITTPSEGSSTWRKETAGQTDINNAINDISVGGRNLFFDSANFGSPYWASRSQVTLLDEYYRECRIYRTANSWSAMTYKNFDNLDLSKEYVLSFYIKSNIDLSSHSGSIFSYGLANSRVVTTINKITTEWQRLSIKGVISANADGIRVELNTAITGGYVYFCGFKLEEGNKATDWTPAPEDVQREIDKAQEDAENAQKEAEKVRTEYKADFVVLDTKIASKVSQTDFNALGQRVSSTEAELVIQTGQISSVVEKVDNLKIEGRNLLVGSTGYYSPYWAKKGTVTILDEQYKGSKIYKNGTAWWAMCYVGDNLTDTKIYTLSFYAKVDKDVSSSDGQLIAYGMHNTPVAANINQFTTEWKKFSIKGRRNIEDKIGIRLELTLTLPNSTSLFLCGLKLEEGDKATDWTPAIEDSLIEAEILETLANNAQSTASTAQTSANNAQNTANLKNRTYYQDAVPTVPSGGHKVGDLWYKTSLVDSSGNINADTSKNIYQLQYRWDGTTWRQINWSVSKSKIEQTDSSITMIVEKTGINSVGAGSSLYSMILQTEDKIVLEVSKVQVGGRNLLLNSSNYSSLWLGKNIGEVITNDYYNGSRIVELYSAWGGIGYIGKNITAKPYIFSFYAKIDKVDASHEGNLICYGTTTNPFIIAIKNLTTEWKQYSAIITPNLTDVSGIRIEPSAKINNNVVRICGFKLEEGNKATDWTPAPEDTQAGIDKAQNTADSKTTLDEVKAGMQIEADGVTIFGEKFTVNSLLIAKAIEAESLNVGGNMIISQNGTITIANGKIILNADGSGRLASGNIVWDKNGNVTVQGKFETNKNGNRTIIDPNLNTIHMINSLNGKNCEILSIGWEDIGFGILRPTILMKEYSNDGSSVRGSIIVSPFTFGMYRDGRSDLPFIEIAGGWASKKIKLSDYSLPTSKPSVKGTLWRDGEYIKIVP